jgi:outer membrane protein
MKSLQRYVIFSIVLVFILSIASLASAQSGKIGFIRDDRIQTEFKDWLDAQESIQLEIKAWEDEANAKKLEFQELLDEYDKQRLILSDDKKREKEAAIRAKQEALDAFTRQIWGPSGRAEQKQQVLLAPLLTKINKAIENVAIEGGFDVIFTSSSGLGYVNPALDVTDKVLTALETVGESGPEE